MRQLAMSKWRHLHQRWRRIRLRMCRRVYGNFMRNRYLHVCMHAFCLRVFALLRKSMYERYLTTVLRTRTDANTQDASLCASIILYVFVKTKKTKKVYPKPNCAVHRQLKSFMYSVFKFVHLSAFICLICFRCFIQ